MSGLYLDHNATAPMRSEARQAWLEVQDQLAGNPSSLHAGGRGARALVDTARETVAGALGVNEEEVIFTSGGTESNNLALFGALRAAGPDSGLVTTAIEHSSVQRASEALEEDGHPLSVIGVDKEARIDMRALESAAAQPGVALVSIQMANNEVGTVQDLERVASCLPLGTSRPLLHTDAAQALGRLPLPLGVMGVDLASFSAHKVGGPVGAGVLVRRRSAPLRPLLHGGGQEGGQRPGTEDVAGIVATARALELAVEERESYARSSAALTRQLQEGIAREIPDALLLGPDLGGGARLPNTLNVILPGCDGRVLVARLDLEGLHTSAGSACASGSLEASHVLLAMGFDEERARAGLRLSIGRDTRPEDVSRAVDILRKTATKTRAS